MSRSVPLTLKHDGLPIRLTLDACRVFMGGEFAGNVELDIDCEPGLQTTIEECLRLQNPGETTSEEVVASGNHAPGISVAFHSEVIERLAQAPADLTFMWCGEPLDPIAAALTDSVPVSQHHQHIDPLQIREHPSPLTANAICLLVQRRWLWRIPAVLFVGAGGLALVVSTPFEALDPIVRYAASLFLLGLGAVLGLIVARLPTREIWYERDRRRISILNGESGWGEANLDDAEHHSVDEFAHVRLVGRRYVQLDMDHPESEEWRVSLEGPIPYACEHGVVHNRSDALLLECFSGESGARRLATEVAYKTGLPILEAGDTFS